MESYNSLIKHRVEVRVAMNTFCEDSIPALLDAAFDSYSSKILVHKTYLKRHLQLEDQVLVMLLVGELITLNLPLLVL